MVPATVVIDSNLLFVLVIGHVSRDHVGRARRTEQYSPEDFDLLHNSLAEYDQVLVTPHVLAETSNLLGYLSEPLLSNSRKVMAAMMLYWDERFHRGAELAASSIYVRLGLTDSALFTVSSASTTLLTDDFPLYLAASRAGHLAINFTHLRQAQGTL
jgi:hypothetical protein